MAKNFVQKGGVLNLVAPYQRNSGEAAMIGSIFGIALNTVANAVAGEFATEGVWDIAKTAAQAWTLGDKIYWNAGTKLVSNLSADGPLVGTAAAAADNPSATGRVRLNGCAAPYAEGQEAAIADLVDNSNGAAADGTLAEVTDLATAGGNTYTDAAVNAKFDLVNDNVKELATKQKAILDALRAAGIIAT